MLQDSSTPSAQLTNGRPIASRSVKTGCIRDIVWVQQRLPSLVYFQEYLPPVFPAGHTRKHGIYFLCGVGVRLMTPDFQNLVFWTVELYGNQLMKVSVNAVSDFPFHPLQG